eukprot:3530750-Prymnesium_polylepis.1
MVPTAGIGRCIKKVDDPRRTLKPNPSNQRFEQLRANDFGPILHLKKIVQSMSNSINCVVAGAIKGAINCGIVPGTRKRCGGIGIMVLSPKVRALVICLQATRRIHVGDGRQTSPPAEIRLIPCRVRWLEVG